MDMHVFQVESNKVLPQQGSILISSPFMNDYHFTRAVVLLIEHNDEGSMGIIMNKDFRYHILLNDLIPELEFAQRVPVYKGGPVSRETIFFLHTLKDLEGALPLGNGLYLNGDFNAVQQYILDGKPIEGVIRFFAGYAGWDHGQLAKEIKENSWLIGKAGKETLLNQHFRDLWHTSLNEMGGKYAIWARYPQYPSLNGDSASGQPAHLYIHRQTYAPTLSIPHSLCTRTPQRACGKEGFPQRYRQTTDEFPDNGTSVLPAKPGHYALSPACDRIYPP